MLKNFRTYQLALELVREGRKLEARLKNPYKDQFQRAILSIALNLAEGSGKDSRQDRRRFYLIAQGSLRETQALIDILELKEIEELADKLGASLHCLTTALTLSAPSPRSALRNGGGRAR